MMMHFDSKGRSGSLSGRIVRFLRSGNILACILRDRALCYAERIFRLCFLRRARVENYDVLSGMGRDPSFQVGDRICSRPCHMCRLKTSCIPP